jgi:hypothetical protein
VHSESLWLLWDSDTLVGDWNNNEPAYNVEWIFDFFSNILQEISKRKANWIGHILCRNCLLQQVIEGKVKGGLEVRG